MAMCKDTMGDSVRHRRKHIIIAAIFTVFTLISCSGEISSLKKTDTDYPFERNNSEHIIESKLYKFDLDKINIPCDNTTVCWEVGDLRDGTTYQHEKVKDDRSSLKVISLPDKTAYEFNEYSDYNSFNTTEKYNGTTSIQSIIENDDYNVFTTKWYIDNGWKKKGLYYSVSAWVWSDKKMSTALMLKSNTGHTAVSAFHSGNDKWEYLTVIYPYYDNPEYFELSLLNKYGTTVFRDITAVLLRDNRYDDEIATPLFAEILFAKKIENRKRILLVGASQIYGVGTGGFTIPVILQTKLESIYPGKYEVVNYGVESCSPDNALISYNTTYPSLNDDLKIFQITAYRPSISSLKPDFIFLSLTGLQEHYEMVNLSETSMGLFCTNSCEALKGKNNCNAVIDALLNYTINPRPDNYKALTQTLMTARECSALRLKMIKEDTNGNLFTLQSIEKKNNFFELYTGGNTHLSHVVKKLISLIGNSSKVYGFTLPTNLFDARRETSNRNYFSYLYSTRIYDNLCHELNDTGLLNCLDIDTSFQTKYFSLNPVDYSNASIFSDSHHFTYRGAEYIADELFSYIKDKL